MIWQSPSSFETSPQAERAMRFGTGAAVAPLWAAFFAAAGAGMAWWWMTSWSRRGARPLPLLAGPVRGEDLLPLGAETPAVEKIAPATAGRPAVSAELEAAGALEVIAPEAPPAGRPTLVVTLAGDASPTAAELALVVEDNAEGAPETPVEAVRHVAEAVAEAARAAPEAPAVMKAKPPRKKS